MFSVTTEDEPEAFGSTMSYWATAALLGLGNPNHDPESADPVDRERAIAAARASAVNERRFAVAKQHLAKVDVVGFSEAYDDFIDELRARFGWWPYGISTKAKANMSREPWGEPNALRQRIIDDNAFDMELYEYAHELVRERRRPVSISQSVTPEVVRERSADVAGEPANSGTPSRRRDLRAEIRAKHPRFFEALVEDAKITAAYRSERSEFHGRLDALIQALRLMAMSDAFLGQALYRAKARLQALDVPALPWIAHRLAMMTAQICIGDPVVVRPGVYLAHGQVVIDGFVEIHRGVVIFPWVTIGLRAGDVRGPTIGRDVHIGTGAKVIGPVTVHRSARIGANAVVVTDVPACTTVVGAPARPTGDVASP
jgi:serine O-acetyltransferase